MLNLIFDLCNFFLCAEYFIMASHGLLSMNAFSCLKIKKKIINNF